MRIKNIEVDGYRMFDNDSVCLEANTTVLAGANNSGKTSFIDLLASVFNSSKPFTVEDYNAAKRFKWSRDVLATIRRGRVDALSHLIEADDEGPEPPRIEVRLEVEYDSELDDIREFADYLMDFDDDTSSFYFCYCLEPDPTTLLKGILEVQPYIYENMVDFEWANPLPDTALNSPLFRAFQSQIDQILLKSSNRNAYFCSSDYRTRIQMDEKDFNRLFHFRSIKAGRQLDDGTEDKTRRLSRKLVQVARQNKAWEQAVKTLPRDIEQAINKANIHEVTELSALDGLNQVLESISKTNGTAVQDLYLDFILADEDINRLISGAMKTQYRADDAALGESSQGLGYSNLIYLHLETESFVSEVASEKGRLRVNVLAIEEPESHMHPQMQNAFINHLFNKVNQTYGLQALVTTHSNEMVRSSSIDSLRTLKKTEHSSKFIDLKEFHRKHVEGKKTEERRLFEFLYQINFADVLFADKVVLYEGDTERMYVQALIDKHSELEPLRTQYVSYVQVGGAYAHIYKPLITDTLNIKSVVITDIDYQREKDDSPNDLPVSIFDRQSTNETLKSLFKLQSTDGSAPRDPTVSDLYSAVSQNIGIAFPNSESRLGIAYQTAADGCARTFEEAILAERFALDVTDKRSRDFWTKKRTESNLRFSIPRGDEPLAIVDLVEATAKNKTDFTYSLLLNEGFEEYAPDYILNALKWLANDRT